MSLGAVHFGSPWALLALLALPLLWFILRASPPAPLQVIFPPLKLLRGLLDEAESPDAAPLWLRLLRLAIATLLVIALAAPAWTPRGATAVEGPVLLIVDNGWASAAGGGKWRQRARAALAGNATRIAPLFTASGAAPVHFVARNAARRVLAGQKPQSWPPERMAALRRVQALQAQSGWPANARITWLSDGLDYGHAGAFMAALARLGPVQVLTPGRGASGVFLLRPPKADMQGLAVTMKRPFGAQKQNVDVVALDADGVALARTRLAFAPGKTAARAHLNLPLALRNRLQLLRLVQTPSAAASWIFGGGWVRPRVGLIAAGGNVDRQPLLSGLYYLNKALAPHAQVLRGVLEDLLAQNPAVLVLTDANLPDAGGMDALEKYVAGGGLLIRFAGPHLASSADALVPVKLRTGRRRMGGAFGWQSPQKLAAFAPTSPYFGLHGGQDAAVRRQVLALPDENLNARVWARLSDGTPLVTSARHDEGRIVLFHVTASPDWSDVPLSGLFAAMLKRTLAFAPGGHGTIKSLPGDAWVMTQALDAGGRLQAPKGAVPVLHASGDFAALDASAAHPPGLYRNGPFTRALNIGAAMTALNPLPAPPAGVRVLAGEIAPRLALKGMLLAAAMVLLMLDVLAALMLAGRLGAIVRFFARARGKAALGLGLALVLLPLTHAHAEDAITRALTIARSTHLAYMITGDARVDAMSRVGLFGLSMTLRQRTTVEPEAPVGVDPARDALAIYALIYWPVLHPPRLSPKAIAALDTYLKNGGMLVIDTQDDGLRARAAGGVDPALAALFTQIQVPPLRPVPADHVLTRSYYLIQAFPGRTSGGRLWVEADARGSSLDGVSGVIAGANDWAAAWALDKNGRPMAALSDDMPRQREMARRFGVNLVMYALTGNYKADQVHIPALLKRLGKP